MLSLHCSDRFVDGLDGIFGGFLNPLFLLGWRMLTLNNNGRARTFRYCRFRLLFLTSLGGFCLVAFFFFGFVGLLVLDVLD